MAASLKALAKFTFTPRYNHCFEARNDFRDDIWIKQDNDNTEDCAQRPAAAPLSVPAVTPRFLKQMASTFTLMWKTQGCVLECLKSIKVNKQSQAAVKIVDGTILCSTQAVADKVKKIISNAEARARREGAKRAEVKASKFLSKSIDDLFEKIFEAIDVHNQSLASRKKDAQIINDVNAKCIEDMHQIMKIRDDTAGSIKSKDVQALENTNAEHTIGNEQLSSNPAPVVKDREAEHDKLREDRPRSSVDKIVIEQLRAQNDLLKAELEKKSQELSSKSIDDDQARLCTEELKEDRKTSRTGASTLKKTVADLEKAEAALKTKHDDDKSLMSREKDAENQANNMDWIETLSRNKAHHMKAQTALQQKHNIAIHAFKAQRTILESDLKGEQEESENSKVEQASIIEDLKARHCLAMSEFQVSHAAVTKELREDIESLWADAQGNELLRVENQHLKAELRHTQQKNSDLSIELDREGIYAKNVEDINRRLTQEVDDANQKKFNAIIQLQSMLDDNDTLLCLSSIEARPEDRMKLSTALLELTKLKFQRKHDVALLAKLAKNPRMPLQAQLLATRLAESEAVVTEQHELLQRGEMELLDWLDSAGNVSLGARSKAAAMDDHTSGRETHVGYVTRATTAEAMIYGTADDMRSGLNKQFNESASVIQNATHSLLCVRKTYDRKLDAVTNITGTREQKAEYKHIELLKEAAVAKEMMRQQRHIETMQVIEAHLARLDHHEAALEVHVQERLRQAGWAHKEQLLAESRRFAMEEHQARLAHEKDQAQIRAQMQQDHQAQHARAKPYQHPPVIPVPEAAGKTFTAKTSADGWNSKFEPDTTVADIASSSGAPGPHRTFGKLSQSQVSKKQTEAPEDKASIEMEGKSSQSQSSKAKDKTSHPQSGEMQAETVELQADATKGKMSQPRASEDQGEALQPQDDRKNTDASTPEVEGTVRGVSQPQTGEAKEDIAKLPPSSETKVDAKKPMATGKNKTEAPQAGINATTSNAAGKSSKEEPKLAQEISGPTKSSDAPPRNPFGKDFSFSSEAPGSTSTPGQAAENTGAPAGTPAGFTFGPSSSSFNHAGGQTSSPSTSTNSQQSTDTNPGSSSQGMFTQPGPASDATNHSAFNTGLAPGMSDILSAPPQGQGVPRFNKPSGKPRRRGGAARS